MAVKAPWDEFSELWSGKGSSDAVFGNYQRGVYTQGQELVNQLQDLRLTEAIREQATADAIRDAMQQNPGADPMQVAIQQAGQQGDVDTLLKYQQLEDESARRDQLQRSGQINSLLAIAKYDPEGAQRIAQHWGVDLQGMDLMKMRQQPEVRGGLKEGLWSLGPDGQVNILRQPAPDKEGGEKQRQASIYNIVDKDGNLVGLDKYDPEFNTKVNQAYAAGGMPYSSMNYEPPEEGSEEVEGPTIFERLTGNKSGTSPLQKQSSSLPAQLPPVLPGESKPAYRARVKAMIPKGASM